MKIAIDIDDVLADFLPTLLQFYNKQHKVNYEKKHFKSYHLWETWGGTREEAIDIVFEFYDATEFTHIPVITGAQNAVNKLKQNHELVIITARPEAIREKTESWINTHFPETFSAVHIANRFSKSGPQTTKAELCEKHAIDLLIDDSLDYALESITPHRRILLFDNPWNQHDKLPVGIKRVYSWKEIEKLIWNS